MIVVQNHDGGEVGRSELDSGGHLAHAVVALDLDLGDGDSVLAPGVGDAAVEVLVLLKDVVVEDLKGDLLLGNSRAKVQSANLGYKSTSGVPYFQCLNSHTFSM